jgi:wee1-like protein kinase
MELLNNDTKHLDKADIFALGLTLYELASGSALPSNGERYQKLREGKIMLPALTTTFTKVLTVSGRPNAALLGNFAFQFKLLVYSSHCAAMLRLWAT